MNLWTSAEIADACGGTASAAFEASGVAFDSREVGPGDLFVAMRGEATDGHRFLGQSFAQGAAGAIASQPDSPWRISKSFASAASVPACGSETPPSATIVWPVM